MEDEEDVHVPLEAFSPTDNVPFSNFDFPESLDLSKILEDELDSNPLPEAVPNHDLSSINTKHDAEALKSLDALISEPTSIETCSAHDHGRTEDCACTHDHEDDDAQHHRLEEDEDGCTHDHHHHEANGGAAARTTIIITKRVRTAARTTIIITKRVRTAAHMTTIITKRVRTAAHTTIIITKRVRTAAHTTIITMVRIVTAAMTQPLAHLVKS